VLHGDGWVPGQRITVALAGRGVPATQLVDLAGTFNYRSTSSTSSSPGPIPAAVHGGGDRARGVRADATSTCIPEPGSRPPGPPQVLLARAPGPAVTGEVCRGDDLGSDQHLHHDLVGEPDARRTSRVSVILVPQHLEDVPDPAESRSRNAWSVSNRSSS